MDTDRERADAFAETHGCEAYTSSDEVLRRDDVQLILVAIGRTRLSCPITHTPRPVHETRTRTNLFGPRPGSRAQAGARPGANVRYSYLSATIGSSCEAFRAG